MEQHLTHLSLHPLHRDLLHCQHQTRGAPVAGLMSMCPAAFPPPCIPTLVRFAEKQEWELPPELLQ